MEDRFRDVQRGYDQVAAEYADRIFGELAHKPFDRALVDRFADVVRPIGPACDVGCGPGHVARYVHERGLLVVGVDLSSEMVVQARRLSPAISFCQGSMLALPFADDSVGGISAMYSIIHVPRDLLPVAFAEMRRTLRLGGALLLAFHLGDRDVHLEEWWGKSVSIDFYHFDRTEIERHVLDVGFVVQESVERPPYPDVEHQSRRAYLLARKPGVDER